jgi:acetyl-CoA acetyltransferase
VAREILERRACITGIGQSDVGRRLGRDPLALTLDACLAAIVDAGLTTRDIDGLSTYRSGSSSTGTTPASRRRASSARS